MRRLEERERDPPERAPSARPVDRRCLVDVGRDRLERGEIEEHHRARGRPRVEAHDRPERGAGVAEPGLVTADDRVQEAVRVEDVDRDRRDRGRGDERGEVERRAEEEPPADPRVDHERNRQTERHLERHDHECVLDRVPNGSAKDRVVEERAVVLGADVAGARDLPEDPPLVEADVDRVPERVDEKDPEDCHRQQDERIAPAGLADTGPEE